MVHASQRGALGECLSVEQLARAALDLISDREVDALDRAVVLRRCAGAQPRVQEERPARALAAHGERVVRHDPPPELSAHRVQRLLPCLGTAKLGELAWLGLGWLGPGLGPGLGLGLGLGSGVGLGLGLGFGLGLGLAWARG